MNASMADGGEYAKKAFKTRAKIQGNNLKQKFGDFSKNSYITTVNVLKPWSRGGCQNAPFAELCKRIGLDIEKSTTPSEHVCNVCARKMQNAVEMTNTDVFADRKSVLAKAKIV